MMHMTFYWSKEVTLLFATWHTSTYLSYSLSLLACLLFSAFYQFLENLRLKLSSSTQQFSSSTQQPLLQPKPNKSCANKLVGALLYGINSGIAYFLMLAVMSFNGGAFLAVVLGFTVGFFLFRGEEEGLVHVDNSCACA